MSSLALCSQLSPTERGHHHYVAISMHIIILVYIQTAQLMELHDEIISYSKSVSMCHLLPFHSTIQVPYVLRGSNRVIPPTMGAKLRESKLAKIARVVS